MFANYYKNSFQQNATPKQELLYKAIVKQF